LSGLPIIRADTNANTARNYATGTDMFNALLDNNKPIFTMNGDTYSFSFLNGNMTLTKNYERYLNHAGHPVILMSWHIYGVDGFVRKTKYGTNELSPFLYFVGYGNGWGINGPFIDGIRLTQLNNAPYFFNPEAQIIPPPTAPRPPTGITLNPDFDIEKIMSEISGLSKHIDRAKDEIIIRIPIITPCSFPEIPEYDFEEFKRDILEEIKNLGNEFNVVNVAKEEENEPGFFQRLRDRIVDFSGLPGLPKIDLPGLSGLYSWLRNILPGLPEIKFPDFAGLIGDIARALTGVISSIRNIYNFLKTIVDLLIVGLRNLFELLFIPPEDFLQNNFNNMRTELNFKLPFQGFIAQIEQLSHMPPPPGRYELLPVGDDFFPAPPTTEIKLLDTEGTINYFLDFIRPHLDPARILISGLYGIFLVYFNIRQMLFLLRGTTFNGMANTIGRMGD